ncbi:uncharacterized protein LOC131046041 isoform X2 [Cryptomeria japonica]|uniref:uncharacterized protein LOC131046041 isoform X2 n=1 Tax=Cryptomeria japonica TaxID=3369 RepID=UPI0027DA12CD|nr:uncharacterized protein LOC131046041 isoform X2 [Cryptomeria japonica]
MDHITSLRNRQHVTSIPRDVGTPFTGASCAIEVGSSSRDPWTTEAQPHIPLASGLFDCASHVRLQPSVTLSASHVNTTTSIGMAMGLSQMQPSTLSFEDLTTTTFLVHDSGPPCTSEGIVQHGHMEGADTDIAQEGGDTDTVQTQDGASQDHVQQDDSSQPPSRGLKRTADEMHASS